MNEQSRAVRRRVRIKLREIRCNRLLEVLAILLHPAAVAHLLERPRRELKREIQLGSSWKNEKLMRRQDGNARATKNVINYWRRRNGAGRDYNSYRFSVSSSRYVPRLGLRWKEKIFLCTDYIMKSFHFETEEDCVIEFESRRQPKANQWWQSKTKVVQRQRFEASRDCSMDLRDFSFDVFYVNALSA